ncbi:uncharacterized protein EI97DRAFT_483413 [Westerdykella ornata]|uniref:Uncharacterized protein n=1 Tax=Westerdykella ornata TaxID=318751 RepID=A0A6A6J9W7_WESOR|nr:uncharacterized protein EI97DRAFT_483413 [Westerdykella ornata]KAF2272778.1 hypothetical protein EI97DRAFT_483413 [Westerdykella ornata]
MPTITRRMSRALSEEHLAAPPPPTQADKETQSSSKPGAANDAPSQHPAEEPASVAAAGIEKQAISVQTAHTIPAEEEELQHQAIEETDELEEQAEFEDMDLDEVTEALHRRDSSALSDTSDGDMSPAASSPGSNDDDDEEDDDLTHTPAFEQTSVLEIIDDNDDKAKESSSTLLDGSKITPREMTSLSAAAAAAATANTSTPSVQSQPSQPKYESIYIPPPRPQDELGPPITYRCWNPRSDGAWDGKGNRVKCTAEMQIRVGEPIRCRVCGSRVLMKTRTKRMMLFEAR